MSKNTLSKKQIEELNEKHGVTYKKYKYTKTELDLIRVLDKFDLTLEKYFEMLDEQKYVCAICHGVDDARRLAIDHDHSTGEVRGLLCSSCNLGLGTFKDNTESLNNAIKYLEDCKKKYQIKKRNLILIEQGLKSEEN